VKLIDFPNPRTHRFSKWILYGNYYYDASDIIHFGGAMTVENLRRAYRRGIFPWHIENLPLPWFCPERRAVLEFADLHIPKSLERERRKTQFEFTIDRAFPKVIENCARVKRNHEAGTWITENFIRSYVELHEAGDAHSVEVWENKELVGGLYGVDAGGVFCGESMFHLRSNASKLALLFLIEHFQKRGATWLDAQVMTPHLEVLGAHEISRNEFLTKLEQTQAKGLQLFSNESS
jgi:leucyl/phenylalanyl-tRNA--protein transferase